MKINITNNNNVVRARIVTIHLKETSGTSTSTKSLGQYAIPANCYIKAISLKGIYKITKVKDVNTKMRVGTVMHFITEAIPKEKE